MQENISRLQEMFELSLPLWRTGINEDRALVEVRIRLAHKTSEYVYNVRKRMKYTHLEWSEISEIFVDDPNDGGTQFSQEAATDGTGDDTREFEDSDTFEGLGVGESQRREVVRCRDRITWHWNPLCERERI